MILVATFWCYEYIIVTLLLIDVSQTVLSPDVVVRHSSALTYSNINQK